MHSFFLFASVGLAGCSSAPVFSLSSGLFSCLPCHFLYP